MKISTEAAESISITPVVVRDMPLRELVEAMLGFTGKDISRIGELLRRGALVSGSSRFRWQGLDPEPASIAALLSTFPDPEPERPFSRGRCLRVVVSGPACRIEIAREAGSQRRFLRGRSFWDVLMEITASVAPRYQGYSYRERADIYVAEVGPAEASLLRTNASALKYSSLEHRVRNAVAERLEFYVERG